MNVTPFLTTLPALLGLTGFVIYFLVQRSKNANPVTLKIVTKLRRDAPGLLPPAAAKFDAATLSKLIENDAALRSQVDQQDFQLLRDVLRQEFIAALVVYGLCGLIFLGGVAFYVWNAGRPHPVSIGAISAESTDPRAEGLSVDLDSLKVHWSSSGDPEDLKVALEALDTSRATRSKAVRSTDLQVVFKPDEFRDILTNRDHNGENRLRVVIQSSNAVFYSAEIPMHVATRILAARLEATRVKIMGMIDNSAIPFYDFQAKLLLWGKTHGSEARLFTLGGPIPYGHNDIRLDPNVKYDFGSAQLIYFGPDDKRTVRTELFNFG